MDAYMTRVMGDAEMKGKVEGKVLAYHDMNLSVSEIAEKCQITKEEVEAILKNNLVTT